LQSTANPHQVVEIGLVRVDVGRKSESQKHLTDLIFKRAKDDLKDAMVATAERHGGKIASWGENRGTFIFPIENPDSFTNCCLAAIALLETAFSVKRDLQLSPDLERAMTIRITCDTGMVACDPHSPDPIIVSEFVDKVETDGHVISTENRVTVTKSVFEQLKNPLKSRFVKWTYSAKLGVDLYINSDIPADPSGATVDSALAQDNQGDGRITQIVRSSNINGMATSAKRWFERLTKSVRSQTILIMGALVLATFILHLAGIVRFFPESKSASQVTWEELVQTPEWRNWRSQVHKILSTGELPEKTLAECEKALADALKIKAPSRPDKLPASLRRDQAIADILMTYPKTRNILRVRFGIYEDSFLGTGLSMPSGGARYEAASVHEYWIKNYNYPETNSWILMRILDPINNPQELAMTVQELIETTKVPEEPARQLLVKKIAQRVMEKDTVKPAVIRFVPLNPVEYQHTLGRPDSFRVFASNLAEVWHTKISDAAGYSGHRASEGRKLYLFVFLPSHPDDVVPATWSELLTRLPEWLTEAKKN
jgi:hypothetical protein